MLWNTLAYRPFESTTDTPANPKPLDYTLMRETSDLAVWDLAGIPLVVKSRHSVRVTKEQIQPSGWQGRTRSTPVWLRQMSTSAPARVASTRRGMTGS